MNDIVGVYKKASEQLQQVVSQTPQRLKQLHEAVQRADLEEQDLLHLAEFESFNAAEGYYITKQIQKVRKKRRRAKEEIEALKQINTVMNNNSKFEAHINGMCKSFKNREEKKKVYVARVRTDLNERFKRIDQKSGAVE